MEKNTIKTIAKALDIRINRLTELVDWQQRVVDDSERQLRTKQGSTHNIGGGLSATFEYDESSASRLHKQATERLARYRPSLKANIEARNDVRKEFGI